MTTESSNKQIKVWDPLVRLFHWTLVTSFLVAYLSGEELLQVHLYSGYLITGLLVVRILWGFIGSRHARFSDFLYAPREIIGYLKSLSSGHPKRYLGHNPAGGVMVILLLASLSATITTGLIMDSETPGVAEAPTMSNAPTEGSALMREEADDDDAMAAREGEEGEEVMEEVHEFFANFTLLLVFLHVAGVIVSSRLHRENLVRAMFTGKKAADPEA